MQAQGGIIAARTARGPNLWGFLARCRHDGGRKQMERQWSCGIDRWNRQDQQCLQPWLLRRGLTVFGALRRISFAQLELDEAGGRDGRR
jgi:hypothetical protein